jgi:ribonucleoside-diphosphate reductase alpha chain
MPAERKSLTHKFRVGTAKGYLTVGLYEDGTPGEIFLTTDKIGGLTRGLLSTVAVLASVMLQHGIPLEKLVEKLENLRFDPEGLTGNPQIPMAKSILDYVGKWLRLRYLSITTGTIDASVITRAECIGDTSKGNSHE